MKNKAIVIGAASGLAIGTALFMATREPTWSALSACRKTVSSQHSGPPAAFISEVFSWGKSAPEDIFTKNSAYDIYSIIGPKLGPWRSTNHRRAALIETILVSSAFESDYNWNEGRDTNANNTSALTQEAGVVQTSCNILNFGSDLYDLMDRECSQFTGSKCQRFIKCTKANHKFAIETHARALRKTNGYKHWGPIARGVVPGHLRSACVAEIESFL